MTIKIGNSKYGTETLEVISQARKFNRWMFETIKPHCSGKILEIGSGIGNISEFFIDGGFDINLSDYENSYFPLLKKKFGDKANLGGINLMDFSDKDLVRKFPDMQGKFDTIFALNVLEHIEDHVQALDNAGKMLKKGGKVIILVPAFQSLCNSFDEQLEHFRRYTSKSLKAVLEAAGFDVVHSQYFNFMAIFGWFFSGKVLRKRIIPNNQLRLFNALVPVWRVLDLFTSRFAGVSVIQVAVKNR